VPWLVECLSLCIEVTVFGSAVEAEGTAQARCHRRGSQEAIWAVRDGLGVFARCRLVSASVRVEDGYCELGGGDDEGARRL
jgi:hypothetical protein